MKNFFSHYYLWILFLLFFCFGCATMIRGTEQTLEVISNPSGAYVELSNGRKGTTPAQFTVKRNETLIVKISKEGYHTEAVTVVPTLSGGGVMLGGIIDYATGAVYNLSPNPVYVILKKKD